MYKQPVAQSPIKALAPGDLGLLGSRNPDMGVESILTPFMQQAEKYSPADCPPDCGRKLLRSQRRPELVKTARRPPFGVVSSVSSELPQRCRSG
jgi:hypothetical protein